MQPLTARAQRWIDGLNRIDPVPLERVQDALGQLDFPTPPAWLDFHEQYAGLIIPIGADGALLGLMHDRTMFFYPPKARGLDVDHDRDDGYVIVCADAHPSCDFNLTENGTFRGGPTADFTTYLEQLAVIDTFYQQSQSRPTVHMLPGLDKRSDLHERVLSECTLDEACSDSFREYWVGETLLGIRDLQESPHIWWLIYEAGY